ncbi:MAG: antitoxin Xre/MbcA/ParS toxin-binding domain-containing protein, partial [Burkholderiales bacterium]
ILYGDKLADEWVKLPNTNAIFGGRTPLEYMIAGGLVAIQTVRKLLDARRGGL